MTTNRTSEDTIKVMGQLFESHFNVAPEEIKMLPVSGSDRRYFRMKAGNLKAIGTYNANTAENSSYFYFTRLFQKHEIHVPEIYSISKDKKAYLQQDLGETSLFDLLMQEGYTDNVRNQYYKALEQLAKLQWLAGREANFDQCFATKRFDEKAIMADLLYFKFYFADLQKIPYDKTLLVNEMEEWSKELGRIQPQMLMYRDFQSRNIMLHDQKTYFIDFQGCMQGPPQYDLASLIWQAKAQLPDAWKEDLLNTYITAVHNLPITKIEEVHFRKGYVQFVLLRLLQVLGAYGFRGLLERKPHFISSIPHALKNLETFLARNPQTPAYPELRSLLERLCREDIQKKYEQASPIENPKLHIQVNSFSYKSGIPKDKSSHGGGFVFDCRGIMNPGRVQAYKYLTGLDAAVQHFLAQETKMPEFMEHARAIVAINVENYLSRGFDSLQISFGCTGGQHRSVFAAEHMANWLRTQYHIPVTVQHMNQKKWILSEEDKVE
jgi:aminoglycoside/choline kinase family phosphotransferase